MYWDKLVIYIQDSKYTIIVMIMLALALVLTGWRSSPLRGGLGLLVLHAVASLMQVTVAVIGYKKTIFDNRYNLWVLNNVNQFAFCIVELLLCSLFIACHVHHRLLKRVVLVGAAAAGVAIGCIFFSNPADVNTSNYFFVVENGSLIAACFVYLADLANQPVGSSLTRRPEYWAIMGMFIIFGGGIILFLFMPLFDLNYALQTIYFYNTVLYCLLFGAYLQALRVARLPVVEQQEDS